MSKRCFFFAAGGTGGHIFPALAIAAAIKKKIPDADIHFVGTRKGLENKIVPQQSDYPLHHLNVGRLNRNVSRSERVKTMLKLPIAFIQAFFLIVKYKPELLFGVGGHASGPLLFVGSLMGKKTFIWEPNAFPGLANRYLARHINKAYVLFDETTKHLAAKNALKVGYPVRERIENTTRVNAGKEGRFRVFVFGGSQGARAINKALWDMIEAKPELLENIEFVHQTGSLDYQDVKKRYDSLPEECQQRIHIFEFVDEMEKYYQWASVAVSRSGMGTLAELAAMGVPGILVPLPTASDNHQQKNAEELVKNEASVMLLQDELTGDRLFKEIETLRTHPETVDLMAENIHKLYKPRAAEEIVEDLLGQS